MKWRWCRMLSIRRISFYICQNPYWIKVPSSNWKSKYSKALLSIVVLNVDPKTLIQHPYYGPKNMWPSLVCTLFRDLNDGDFVLVRLHDPSLVPILMWIAQGDFVKDEESAFFKMVKVQWWVLVKKGINLDEQHLYEDY